MDSIRGDAPSAASISSLLQAATSVNQYASRPLVTSGYELDANPLALSGRTDSFSRSATDSDPLSRLMSRLRDSAGRSSTAQAASASLLAQPTTALRTASVSVAADRAEVTEVARRHARPQPQPQPQPQPVQGTTSTEAPQPSIPVGVAPVVEVSAPVAPAPLTTPTPAPALAPSTHTPAHAQSNPAAGGLAAATGRLVRGLFG